jgi:hypothetical protein
MVRGQRKWFEFCIHTSVELAVMQGTPLLIAYLSNPQGRWQNQELTNHQEERLSPSLRRVHNDDLFSRTHLDL